MDLYKVIIPREKYLSMISSVDDLGVDIISFREKHNIESFRIMGPDMVELGFVDERSAIIFSLVS